MSTFGGIMDEMDYISIDRFDDKNLKSHAFFLSHCHWDHMQGIDQIEFQSALQKNEAFLYMSSVSQTISNKMFPYLSSKIKVLDIGKNFIDIPSIDKTFCVTLIPAGHCPGSVMFLFESEKTILYTGDIRLRAKELEKFKQLYDSTGRLKRIDNLYLDTTFFLTAFEDFPPRDESITEFCNLINDWLYKDKENFVVIDTPANYGSENLFLEIFDRCKYPIHVNQNKYDVYKNIPELDLAITTNPDSTRISNAMSLGPKDNKLIIKPSALCWRNLKCREGIVEKRNGTFHVCYSSHCSYNELIDIIKLLKPLKIMPNVLQKTEKDNEEMYKNIENILQEIHNKESSDSSDNEIEFENKINWTNNDNNKYEDENEENEEFFNFLNSPESKRKKF